MTSVLVQYPCIEVSCPLCNAQPGQACVVAAGKHKGTPTYPHQKRSNKYRTAKQISLKERAWRS